MTVSAPAEVTPSPPRSAAPPPTPSARSAPSPGVLLGSQLVFNIGFFAVVPFLAGVLREDFALAGAAVGLVLGARTAAQQGLFVVGGALADRLGARMLILSGCAVRVSGFATLAWSTSTLAPDEPGLRLGLFVAGTILTGMGGALFSPALELLVARAEAARSVEARPRVTLFALLAVVGETGAAIGPVAGAALLGWGFTAVAAAGALLFAGVAGALALLLPRERPAGAAHGTRTPDAPACAEAGAKAPGPFAVVRDRRFMALAVLASVDLLAYNQLYLGLPVELTRAGLGEETLAAVFVLVSVLTITLQVPLAAFVRRWREGTALRVGYLLISAAFALLALTGPMPPERFPALPALAATALLTLGHLVLGPLVLSLVPRFAPQRCWGSYYGMLATCGGVSVLLGNVVLGALYPSPTPHRPSSPGSSSPRSPDRRCGARPSPSRS